MEKKNGVLDYLSQIFMHYGIISFILNIFVLIFGESAREISTIFSLGSDGVSVSTSLLYLLALSIITALRFLLMSDRVIKKMPLTARIILMFTGVFGIAVVFIIIFGWFPVDRPLLWILFIVCFAVCCAVSTVVSIISKRLENKRLEEALKRCKEEQ